MGHEPGWPDGTVIEVAWPAVRVGILPAGAAVPADADGWTLRASADWTESELLSVLAGRAS